MLCMLKHTLFSCVYAKGVFSRHKITSMQEAQAPKLDRFSNTAAALANLCISVYYGKLNLMPPSASKSQKITFTFMKCTKLLPPELVLLAQICTKSSVGWGFAPDPTEGAYSAPRPPSWFRSGTPGGRGRGRGGKGRGRWDWDPPPGTGREGKGMEGRMG